MKNPFEKGTVSYPAEEPLTPYMRAQQEWDERIGSARAAAQNWRLVAFFSLLLSLFLLFLVFFSLALRKDRIYVAEVAQSGRVINVAPLTKPYHPTIAAEEYFISHFIELIRALPLDPVVAKKNWLDAYNFLDSRGAERLNAYFRQNNPVALLGKKTIAIKINTINSISENSFEVEWTENTVSSNGQDEGQKKYAAVFTINLKQPTTQNEILQNPLGIYIVDFSMSTRNN